MVQRDATMPDLRRFILDCEAHLDDPAPMAAITPLVAEVIRDSAALDRAVDALGSPLGVNATLVHRTPRLTILRIKLVPGFYAKPHDHLMWVIVGAYIGQEDNVLYRREAERLVEIERRSLVAPTVFALDEHTLHSVRNPLATPFTSLQICGGDFVGATPHRSQWDPDTFEREPFRPPSR